MTVSMPSIPAIGETVVLYGGTIQRAKEHRFIASFPGRKLYNTTGRPTHPMAEYTRAVNFLRRAADLHPLPMPCRICGVNPCRNGTWMCADCDKTYVPKRARKATEEAPLVPMDVALEILHKIAPDPLRAEREAVEDDPPMDIHGSLRTARLKADDLIARRTGKRPPANNYIRPEKYLREEWVS